MQKYNTKYDSKDPLLERLEMPKRIKDFFNLRYKDQNSFGSLNYTIKLDLRHKNYTFRSQPSSLIIGERKQKIEFQGKTDELKYIFSYLINIKDVSQDNIKFYNYHNDEITNLTPYLINIPEKKPASKVPEKINNALQFTKESAFSDEDKSLVAKLRNIADLYSDKTEQMCELTKYIRTHYKRPRASFKDVGIPHKYIEQVEMFKLQTATRIAIPQLNKMLFSMEVPKEIVYGLCDLLEEKEIHLKQDVMVLRALSVTGDKFDKGGLFSKSFKMTMNSAEYIDNRNEYQLCGLSYLKEQSFEKGSQLLGAMIKFLRLSENKVRKDFEGVNLTSIELGTDLPDVERLHNAISQLKLSKNVRDNLFDIMEEKKVYPGSTVRVLRSFSDVKKFDDKEQWQINAIDYLIKHLDKKTNITGAVIKFLRLSENMKTKEFGEGFGASYINMMENGDHTPTVDTFVTLLDRFPTNNKVKQHIIDGFVKKGIYSLSDISTQIIHQKTVEMRSNTLDLPGH